ncbi:MAG: bifunctional diguanylate cyclase/phosphodiesterase [Gammaproteobacteria bacterium]|nr:bifunctional diguanylate cyclase/phosphodiesterase [Gammaproteobacteria bacterium]
MTTDGTFHDDGDSGVVALIDSLQLLRRLLHLKPGLAPAALLQQVAQATIGHPAFAGCAIRTTSGRRGDAEHDTASVHAVSVPTAHIERLCAAPLVSVMHSKRVLVDHDLSRSSAEQRGSLAVVPVAGEGVQGAVAVWHPQTFRFRQWHENLLFLVADALVLLLSARVSASGARVADGSAPPPWPATRTDGSAPQIDPKTGLMNRAALESHLQQLLDRRMGASTDTVLLHINIDRFRLIRDIGGDAVADRVIELLAVSLREQLSDAVALARVGGDQFCAVLHPLSQVLGQRRAQAVIDSVELLRMTYAGQRHSISVSVGALALSGRVWAFGEALQQARDACRAAQRQGGGVVRWYDDTTRNWERVCADGRMLNELTAALKEDGLRLYAQAIVPACRTGEGRLDPAARFEILLRILDQDGQVLSAGVFLPVAERYGLSVRLDRWVVRETFRALASSQTRLARTAVFAINLSGRSIGDDGFLDYVVEQLGMSGIDPRRICFELTETAAISDLVAGQRFVEALKQLGFSFALDDFGSGYSSFLHLRDLPVDILKIDGTLVHDIIDDPASLAIVRSIHDIGKAVGKKTIAEYVESQALFDRLAEIGVDLAQGYWIGEPQPLAELLARDDAAGHPSSV